MLRLLSILLLFNLSINQVFAENIYITAKSGLVFPKNTDSRNEQGFNTNDIRIDDGISYGLEAGYSKDYWRISLSGHIRKNSEFELGVPSSGQIQAIIGEFETTAIFANAYIDFQTFLDSGKLNPFVRLGFGHIRNKIDQFSIPADGVIKTGDSDTGFGWSAGAGLGYWIKKNIALEFEYSVSELGDWQSKIAPQTGRESGEYASADFLIGLRFDFKDLEL